MVGVKTDPTFAKNDTYPRTTNQIIKVSWKKVTNLLQIYTVHSQNKYATLALCGEVKYYCEFVSAMEQQCKYKLESSQW